MTDDCSGYQDLYWEKEARKIPTTQLQHQVKYEERKTNRPGQLDRRTPQIGLVGDFFFF